MLSNRPLIIEDCDVIYARAGWHHWSGGRVFNMRCEGEGDRGKSVVFRNIRVEDPRPTFQTFFIVTEGVAPYFGSKVSRKPGNLPGVLFQNIEIAAPNALNEPDILWGSSDAQILGITFDNVTVSGKKIRELKYFKHNEFAQEVEFK